MRNRFGADLEAVTAIDRTVIDTLPPRLRSE
jgi:hypothetical protein